MSKPLSEMTLEELWTLFPIILTEHQPQWDAWYEEEKAALVRFLPNAAKINHIGSTAVNEIWAKPIVDILVEVPAEMQLSTIKSLLCANGFICMSQAANRFSFNKGYTAHGYAERVFHLHLRCDGDHDELYFRDYLREHPEVAREYERMKLKLWRAFEHNRDAYTDAKTAFVQKYTDAAKADYRNRYDLCAGIRREG